MTNTVMTDANGGGQPSSHLERALGRTIQVNWELVAWIALVAVTMATRLWFLGARAMSHDESLHTFYAWRLFNGEGYVHDPMMHGPFLYHLTALVYFLFGVSDFTARLLTVFLGLGLVLSPLLARRYLGPVGTWVTGAILVMSPTVMYYTRYIRHDIHVELFIVLLFVSLFRFLDTRKGAWIVAGGVAAAGAITSAEMSYIMGFLLVTFVIMALLAERIGSRWAEWLAVALGIVGLGLLIFAVIAGTGNLGSIDKGTLLHSVKQVAYLFGGVSLALALGVGLLARFGTQPLVVAEPNGRTLRDVLAQNYFGPESGHPSVAMLAVSGVVVVGFGLALTRALMALVERGGTVCAPASPDARCVLTGLVGMGVPALGFFLLLFAISGALVAVSRRWANLATVGLGGLGLVLGLLLFRWQHANADTSFATQQPMVYLVDGLLIAAGLAVLYGLLGWLLERDEERGLAEALASAPVAALALAVVAFAVLYVLMFTTLFSNPKGIYGFWDSVKYWVQQHDVVRGDQPWYYYGIFAPMYEFLPLLLSLAAILAYSLRPALRVGRGNDRGTLENPEPGARIFVPMLITWAIGVFWMFSWAGEKMPWLLVHLVVPQAFIAGRLVGDMADRLDWVAFRERGWMLAGLLALFVLVAGAALLPFGLQDAAGALQSSMPLLAVVVLAVVAYGLWLLWRQLGSGQAGLIAGLTLVGVLALLNTRYALMANFVNGELATEYIVYAHGTPDDKLVYNTLLDLQERVGVDRPLKIIYDNEVSWPFTWYFRNSDWAEATYVGEKPTGSVNADVALVGSPNYGNFEPYLGKRYVSTEFTRMWWPNEGYKNLTLDRVWQAASNPRDWRNILNILLYRRYTADPQSDDPQPKSLTDWYHHSNMKLYVNKDLIEEAWPLVQARPEWLREIQSSVAAVEVPELKLARDMSVETLADGKPLTAPKDVTLGPNGDLYVVDHGNYRVVVFGPDGVYSATVGNGEFFNPPSQSGQADEPTAWGIGISPSGNVYVADTWKHQVVKYDTAGKRERSWGTYGNPDDKTTDLTSFYGPRDVAVAPDGNVYVTDTGNSRILVFDADGNPVRAITDAGPDLGVFNEPTSLAFDPATGELYVADLWNRRIVRFKADLTPDTAWDVDGWSSEEAAHKAYIAVGPNGVVVFSDPAAQRVWLYSHEGKALGTLDLPMDDRGLDQPIGVAVDDQGRIIVVASNTGLVTRYQPADVIFQAGGQQSEAPAAGAAAGEAGEPQEGSGAAGLATRARALGRPRPRGRRWRRARRRPNRSGRGRRGRRCWSPTVGHGHRARAQPAARWRGGG